MINRLFSIFSRTGLRSLKQRYAMIAIFISLVLILGAYFGWKYVDQKSQVQLQNLINRTTATDILSDVVFQIHTIEKSLLLYISVPSEINEKAINQSFLLFDTSISKLRKNAWIKKDETILGIVISLMHDKRKLQSEVEHLLKLRKNENAWVPVMGIMQEQMLEQNLQLSAALNLYIYELKNTIDSEVDIEIFSLLNDIRYSWQKVISEFRLYVSNAFGIFTSDREDGMRTRSENIHLYIENTHNLINELDETVKRNNYDLYDLKAAEEMRSWINKWKDAYHDVQVPLSGDQWRQDLVLLKNRVEPLFRQIHQRSSSMELELGVESAKNISELTSLAKELLNFVVLVVLSIIVSAMFGYFVFNHSILMPIQRFGTALKLEAKDSFIDPANILSSHATEFENLKSAFLDMRNQIQLRQRNLDHMAHHDALTQLPNRFLLRDRLERSISRARREKNNVGLIFLDLDRFKKINDSLGHDVGDQLLVQVAERLLACVRDSDTVSRLGGDEFAIVVESVNIDQIANMARKILSAFDRPFKIGHHELFSTTSIGIAMGPTDDENVDILIKDADIAMYHAKDLGRNTYKFYSSEMAAQVAEHMALENQLHHAVDAKQFFLVYQPIIELKTGKVIGTEALVRWEHPENGIVGPDRFIKIAEDSGLIRSITQWVLIEACNQLNEYKKAGLDDVSISVNLSGVLLKSNSVLDIVINALEQTKVDPSGLIMEITEDTLLEDLQGAEKALKTLKEMGMRIALDDFGTGQSSLSHLRMNPIDIVKIDRSFVRDIPGDKNDMELVDAVIAMAHKLHMKVIAEGAETEDQVEFLRWHNCDAIQGYYYSQPIGQNEIIPMLRKSQLSLMKKSG